MATKPAKVPPRPKRTKAETEQEFALIQEELAEAREALGAQGGRSSKGSGSGDARRGGGSFGRDRGGRDLQPRPCRLEVVGGAFRSTGTRGEPPGNGSGSRCTGTEGLERLHKIDVAATALDQLVQDYGRQKEQLESEIAAQRSAWQDELRQTERDRKEQDELLKKQRQRETDEYEYRKAQERKKAQDKYDEEQKLVERTNKEKQDALEKSWREREAALKASEEELKTLRKEAAEFPARLQKESEKAAGDAVRASEQKSEQRILLLAKDSEGDKRLAELRIKTLEDNLTRQSAQMAALEKQLEEAKRQVQEIAVKAIEGASGAKALTHINEIAMEQAKHRTPQG